MTDKFDKRINLQDIKEMFERGYEIIVVQGAKVTCKICRVDGGIRCSAKGITENQFGKLLDLYTEDQYTIETRTGGFTKKIYKFKQENNEITN